jgi:hypothetical protein
MTLRTVNATSYVTPLREGGSLPAIVEADDDGTYVVKFRGAGQGPRALIADLLGGEIARALGLRVPELAFIELDDVLGSRERDPEIQHLLDASVGLNLAVDYLPGSLTFDPLAPGLLRDDPALASSIVWLDAFITNIDRTPRNTNLLVWHKQLWLIDHGASLYFHHKWDGYREKAVNPFPEIRNHVLLPFSNGVRDVDEVLATRLDAGVIQTIVQLIPESWLGDVPQFPTADAHRAAYAEFLLQRLEAPRAFAEEAANAHHRL